MSYLATSRCRARDLINACFGDSAHRVGAFGDLLRAES
jgi:hypothetical protein